MRKQFNFLILFLLFFCTNLSAEQLVLERKVTNHVQRYYDKTWFDEAGTVRIYLNEFSDDKGRKFGWAFSIESNMLNNAGINTNVLNDETECPLMYYIDNNRFYIGYVWTNSFVNEVTQTHVFYDFCIEDGYGLYFMYAYASAVNSLLTYENKITFCELYDETGHNKFITNDEAPDLSFNTGDFKDYQDYSKFRLENGDIDGQLVWIDGEWRDITNKYYIDQTGITWRAHNDVTGFHVKQSKDSSRINWYEPAIIFPAFRTVQMRLVKNAKTKSSKDAGNEISANLKKHGLWKSKSPMVAGDGTTLGKHGPNEGVITCWYEPFCDSEGPSRGLGDKSNKNLLIDYKKLSPHSLKQ